MQSNWEIVSPWYVVEPATDCKHPLIQCFKWLYFLSIKVQQPLGVKRGPERKDVLQISVNVNDRYVPTNIQKMWWQQRL